MLQNTADQCMQHFCYLRVITLIRTVILQGTELLITALQV